MISKRKIKAFLKDYMPEGIKILNIDCDLFELGYPIEVAIKYNDSICFYTLYHWELGCEYAEVYRIDPIKNGRIFKVLKH